MFRVNAHHLYLAIRFGNSDAAGQEHAYTRINFKGLIQKVEITEVDDLLAFTLKWRGVEAIEQILVTYVHEVGTADGAFDIIYGLVE